MKPAANEARAFTLLELLIAVTITATIAAVMLVVASGVLESWRRNRELASAVVNSRLVLDALERDLQAALFTGDGCFAVDVIDTTSGLANHGWLLGPGIMKPAGASGLQLWPEAESGLRGPITGARYGLSGAWLRFVTTNVESAGSLPVVVAYQLVRRPVTGNPVANNPAPVRYGLYRSAVGAGETFLSGYDVTAAAYRSTSNNPTSALSTAYRQPRNVTNPSHANLLATNVVDFGCRLYAFADSGGLRDIFPSSSTDVSYRAMRNATDITARFPAVVDVMVRLLDEEGVAQVEAMEGGRATRPVAFASDAEWWWSVVLAHSRTFVRRIEIKGSGP